MNIKKVTQTLVIALAMIFTLAIVPTLAFGQDKADGQTINLSADDSSGDLVGVWEEVAPGTVDCVTRLPNSPVIRILYTINQGGTMYEEDTFAEDRNRTTGGGIWKQTVRRNYSYLALHYAFDADKNFLFTIKQRSNLKLSRNGNSFTEVGTFEGVAPNGNVLFGGCFEATAHRVTF